MSLLQIAIYKLANLLDDLQRSLKAGKLKGVLLVSEQTMIPFFLPYFAFRIQQGVRVS